MCCMPQRVNQTLFAISCPGRPTEESNEEDSEEDGEDDTDGLDLHDVLYEVMDVEQTIFNRTSF